MRMVGKVSLFNLFLEQFYIQSVVGLNPSGA